jgi:predicted thioredoxin/glutaredoxin
MKMNMHSRSRKLTYILSVVLLLTTGMNLLFPSGSLYASGGIVSATASGVIRGAIYIDWNANGRKDEREECINFLTREDHFRCAQVVLRLYMADATGKLSETATNAISSDTGDFVFTNLNPGTFSVCEIGFHHCSAPHPLISNGQLDLGFVLGNLPTDPIPSVSAFAAGCNRAQLGTSPFDLQGFLSRSDPILTPLVNDPRHPFPNDPPVLLEGTIPPLADENSNSEANSEVSEEELPWYHYTHDKTQQILPDDQYRGLLSTNRSGDPVSPTIEVEWESASNMNLEGDNMVWGGLPEYAWPSVGNRVWIEGRWVFDCGHSGLPDTNIRDPLDVAFKSEIHPPRALVTFRQNFQPGGARFADTNGNGHWDAGEPIVYDLNGNGVYETADPGARFIDANGNGHWDPYETLIFDTTHPKDPRIKFADSNGDGKWEPGEEGIAYDSNNDGIHEKDEPEILCPCNLPAGTFLGEPVLAGTAPAPGTPLTDDAQIKFIDANHDNVWNKDEPIVYDSNGNGVYDPGEPWIAGSAPATAALLMNIMRPAASGNWLPVTGEERQLPVTEADIFVSGNGGGANDFCGLRLSKTGGLYSPGYNICSHTGPVSVVNDRNYVFDIYPPGTDYGSREANGTFKVKNIPSHDGSGTDVSLQWRFIDQFSQVPQHACGPRIQDCITIAPILCPIDASVGPPTQTETGCPPRPAAQHPTRLRVILPFAGTRANLFAESILLGWDDVPLPTLSTYKISLHKLHIIQNGQTGATSGDWRVFVDVGGQWRYMSELSYQHFNGCDEGDKLYDNGDDDCFGFDNHPWYVTVPEGEPIHVAVGGFQATKEVICVFTCNHTVDSDYCRNLSGCDSSAGAALDVALHNDQRIGTIEFDLKPPYYHIGSPIEISTKDIKGGDAEIDYDVSFTVEQLPMPFPPLSYPLHVGGPSYKDSASGVMYVTSATPLTLSTPATGLIGFQYRFHRDGTPLPTFPSRYPFPLHWTNTGFNQTTTPRTIFLNNFDGADGVYILQFMAQKKSIVENKSVVDTEPWHTYRLILDNTAPQSTLTIGSPPSPLGPQQPFVTSATPFTVAAVDGGSGVQSVSYRFFLRGSAPPSYTTIAASQAQFTLSGPNGLYEIDTLATDLLGNVEHTQTQFVSLDNTLPEGYYNSGEDSQHVIIALSSGNVQEVWWRSGRGVHQDQLAHINGSITSVAGYYDSREDSQHVIVALSNGDIQEVSWRSGRGVHQNRLIHFDGNILNVSAYYDSREDSQHVIVTLSNGNIQELWWRSGRGVHQDQLAHLTGNITSVAGYYDSQEDSQHVIVALSSGNVQEVWWHSGRGVHQDQLAHFNGNILNVTGYYDSQEDSQHVIVALSSGNVQEVWWRSGQGVHQDQLAHFNGNILNVTGYYDSREDSQHAIVTLNSGDIQELWWHSGQGVHQDQLAHFKFS